MSILIVDEQPERLRALESMLARDGRWKAVGAGSIEGALRVLASGRIQAVLVDLMAPRMRGLELCTQVRDRRELRHVPVVVVLGAEDRGQLGRVYEAGACDYITRPLHIEEVVARVQAVIRSREEIARRAARERELVAANWELMRLAAVDPVTGVANRRSFDQTMHRVWRSCARGKREVALLMIDVDYFKPYNDRLGHPAGDKCLKCVAGALAEGLLRADDFLARYGGEEFAVILPETSLAGACVVAERLSESIRSLGITHPASPAGNQITISQGAACQIPQHGSNATRLIAMADRALYEAKKRGRNQVRALSDFAAGSSHNRTHGSPEVSWFRPNS